MAVCAARPLVDAPSAEPDGQLDDGETVRAGVARFWDDVQSLPARDHSGNSIIWRAAPVYSGAGQLDRRAHHGSADYRWRAQEREEQQRNRTDDSRFSGFDDCEVFAGLLNAATAIFWFAGRCGDRARSGAGGVPGV